MEIVEMKNNQPMTTSKIVADKFNKVHRDVLRAIDLLDCSDDFRVRNFAQSSYKSKQNKELECYEITRDGFMFLCMGFTGKNAAEWKESFINAFNSMSDELRFQASNKSSMQLLNEATKLMEGDKEIASNSGKQLNEWKKKKKEHIAGIKKLVDDAQLTLGFNIN